MMIGSADVVVIGGGLMGSSVAFHLTRMGVKKVVVVEKDYVAAGASGRSSAILRQHYGLAICGQMAHWSLQVWRNFDDVVGGNPGFMPVGYAVAVGARDEAILEGIVARQRSEGINTRLLTPEELREVVPGARVEGVVTGAHEADTGCVDPVAAVSLFAAAARGKGAEILEGTRVLSISTSGGKVTGVATDQGLISTGTVMCCANGWTAALARTLGVEIPLRNCRQEIAMLRRPEDFARDHPIFSDGLQEAYFRPHPGALTYVGSSSPADYGELINPDSYDLTLSPATLVRRRSIASRRFEPMSRAVPRGGYAAFYDMSPDRQFILDRAETVDGFYFACGFSGHGFKHGPIVGKMLAELITQGRSTDFDIRTFRLSRFREGKPLIAELQYRSTDGLR